MATTRAACPDFAAMPVIYSRPHKRLTMRTVVAAVAFGLICAPALADWDDDACRGPLPTPTAKFSGVVTWIGDGDMLCIGPDRDRRIEVRVSDFNAPELNQPGGIAARDALRGIALNKVVARVGTHHNGERIVARCTLNGRSVGDLMREAGVPEGGN